MATLTPSTAVIPQARLDHVVTPTTAVAPVVGTGLLSGPPAEVIEHQPIIEKEIIVEHPVEIRREHHVQPIIHEREHQIQPIIKTEVTTERRVVERERDVLLPPVVEQPIVATAEPRPLATTSRDAMPAPIPSAVTMVPATTTGRSHATLGQKIKGTFKQVQGAITHNPAKKEEGRLLKRGIQPTKHSMA